MSPRSRPERRGALTAASPVELEGLLRDKDRAPGVAFSAEAEGCEAHIISGAVPGKALVVC